MSHTLRTALTATVLTGDAVGGLALAAHASAKGGGGVRTTVACATGTLQLKAEPDDPKVLQVEAELDTNVIGQTWAWTLTDNGVAAGHGSATIVAPSGAFTVRRTVPDRAGTDTLRFRVTRGATVCTARVTL